MADAARARKVADRIHETVARLLQGRIKDPRLGFVTVTDVRVTGDLQQATIFYTVYGSDEEREETARALRSAKGLIRSEVGKALGIRLTPSLTFQLDALPTSAKTSRTPWRRPGCATPRSPRPPRAPPMRARPTPTVTTMTTRQRSAMTARSRSRPARMTSRRPIRARLGTPRSCERLQAG